LVNGTENLEHFRFSKTVFGCVLLSGSQLLLFELSPPVVSQQFQPLAATVAASGGLRTVLGVSAANLTAQRVASAQHR
jgi:hypothetical protein